MDTHAHAHGKCSQSFLIYFNCFEVIVPRLWLLESIVLVGRLIQLDLVLHFTRKLPWVWVGSKRYGWFFFGNKLNLSSLMYKWACSYYVYQPQRMVAVGISNMGKIHWQMKEVREMCIIAEDTLLDYAFLEVLCDGVIIHCYVKYIKPNKRFYALCYDLFC